MRRCLMMVSLLGLSAGWALAQPAPEYFKLIRSSAESVLKVDGVCQQVVEMIAFLAPELGGTPPNVNVPLGIVHITFPKDKRTITLNTIPQQSQCTANLKCNNPEGGGAEALCQQVERLVQDLQRK